ncbi:hypothetical protein ACFW1A_20490 [Kitasatospora sp. NPDC058965]|uniref:hypothetical protein n=1 Tax=Kitasatospora sp. NPDC058965 TaxID=3346682 RepID=UPI0036AA52B5
MADYRVRVTLSQASQQKVHDLGLSLYVLKAVCTNSLGDPLIWTSTSSFLDTLEVSWQPVYSAYVSTGGLPSAAADVEIHEETIVPVQLGQRWQAPDRDKLFVGGTPGAVEICSDTPYSCGLAQSESGGQARPVCGLTLTAQGMVTVTPTQRILLMFSPDRLALGRVVREASGPALLVDAADAPDGLRELAFDPDAGWSTGTGPWPTWAQRVSGGQSVGTLLVAPC